MEAVERFYVDLSIRPDGLRDGEKARTNYRKTLRAERDFVRDIVVQVAQEITKLTNLTKEDAEAAGKEVFDKLMEEHGNPRFVYSAGFLRDELNLEEDWIPEEHADMLSVVPEITQVNLIGKARLKVEVMVNLFKV